MATLTRLDYEKLKKDYELLAEEHKKVINQGEEVNRQFETLLKKLIDLKIIKSWFFNGGFTYEFEENTTSNYYKKLYEETARQLEEGRKRWAYYEARFIKCSTCTPEEKEKCLMFSENLCEGERCEVLIDLESLLDKATDNGKL